MCVKRILTVDVNLHLLSLTSNGTFRDVSPEHILVRALTSKLGAPICPTSLERTISATGPSLLSLPSQQ